MRFRMNYLFIWCLLASIYSSQGCTMEGVITWQLPITVRIEDYHDGIVLQRSISDISGFTLTSYSDLNGGPYIVASIENSAFILRTNEAYRLFEEYETADLISLTYAFTCSNGQTPSSPITFRIEINDNNNNAPLFKTPDSVASETTTYDFTIATPVPPGFLITNCVSGIIVRDIDLTTYRIDFSIEDNPYIGIEYDEAGSTDAKEFKALLRSTTFIRSIPEPITLTISATDVDRTGDPPITRSTTVTIHGDTEFEMPLDPVFSQTFYLANYYESGQVTMEQPISLEQGYDELVQFSLGGDYASDYFDITVNGNLVTLSVTSPLPTAVLQEGQIYLVVRAAREFTSGATATVVVQLPEVVHLEFERPHYEGEIVDNTLQLTQLILSQGYQGSTVTVTVEDYSAFFAASVVGNTITLSMTPLDDSIIQENNFINLRVTASTDYSTATTIVSLEIVKDDVTTPVFDQTLYTGTYDPTTGLTVDPLLLVRGYDDTVIVSLSGEYQSYFELTREGPSSTLLVAGGGLPSHILSLSHIHLSVQAAKPRTVGASAVVAITLPGAREMQFEAQTYRGSVQDNILTLDTIALSIGYEEDVTFSLSGDYSTSFSVSNVQNQVTINMPTQLPQDVISENNFLILTLTAEGLNALPTTTAVLLEIIKVDATTPVFSQPIYEGSYSGSLSIDLGNINLIQGYDSDVTFRIQGDNSEYFTIAQNQNSVTLIVQSSIPEDVIFQEKVFVFNIFADKPLTVGANAAIVIKFSEDLIEPTIMQFAKNTYMGSLENNELTLENIVVETGFTEGTEFYLSGDYEASFTHTVTNNIVTLSMTSGLPAEVLENNKFIVLELEARRDRAVPVVTGIIIDLVKEEIIVPVFSQAYYKGIYTEENALEFQEIITLMQGYDETVTFGLEGESAAWFTVEQNGNSATIVSSSPVPQDVLDSNHQLLFTVIAHKFNSINGHAAISIELPKELLEQEVLRFDQSSYEGQLDGSQLQVPTITLSNDITDNVVVSLSGVYGTYFTATRILNTVHIELVNELPSEILSNNEFIVLDIIASKTDAVSGYTALVLSIVKEPIIVTPVFEQPYYTGEITEQGGLLFEHTMRLIQGFDETVSFALSGESAAWFTVVQDGNSATIVSSSPVPQDVLDSNHQLLFTVLAYKFNSVNGHAAISIELPKELLEQEVLRFDQSSYEGQLDGSQLQVPTITLSNDITDNVVVSLSGVYGTYFTATRISNTVHIQLVNELPSEVLSNNDFIVLDIIASKTDAVSGYTALVLSIVKEPIIVTPVFEQPYYTGEITEQGGLLFEHTMRLIQGFDETVSFALSGDESERFTLTQTGQNSLSIFVAEEGMEGIEDISHFVFSVVARKTGSVSGHATIVIHNTDSSTARNIRFSQNHYKGSLQENILTMESMTIIEGYSSDIYLTLNGDYVEYFQLVGQEGAYTLQLVSNIPNEIVETQTVLVYTVEAIGGNARTHATVIIELIKDNNNEADLLAFEEAYYVSSYSATSGVMDTIQLRVINGYESDAVFTLQGDNSVWFDVQHSESIVTISLAAPLPVELFIDNQPVIFAVNGINSGGGIATATIVVSLEGELTELKVLGFEQNSYLGTIDSDTSTLPPITLTQGYSPEVHFTLHGDLSNYFIITKQDSTVEVELQNAIPDDLLPANRVIVLELQATAVEAVAATATIVFEVVVGQELSFSAAHYVGHFSEAEGLVFESTISLDAGYHQDVQFTLEGDHAQWFALQLQENSVFLTLTSAIPAAIIADNHQLVFGVRAQKPRSNIAKATIVISLIDDSTEVIMLGFEHTSYLGSIENNVLSMEPIVLNEGYTDAVMFTLTGDLASYFNIQQQDSTVNIVLQSAIPEQTLPANGIVILGLAASAPQSIAATTTLVIETQQTPILEELAFSNSYYIGEYSETSGLRFDSIISLDVGYDQNVHFTLEGDHSQWFTLEVQGNVVTLTLSGAIPPAILVNNHQLVFLVVAQNLDANTAKATMVISLLDDYTDAIGLGFEQASYLGSIENGALNLEPIILNEGYTDTVTFTLSGDLASYFTLQQQGSTVNIVLHTVIPEQTLPSNGLVLLHLRASGPDAIPATTVIVIEGQRPAGLEELAFSAPHYIGQYSETEGLAFDSIISLDVGYDQNVQFALEGEHSQWFALDIQGNAVTLTTTGAIPPAILVNNHHFIFHVTAEKPNSNMAMSTIVVSLVDDYTDAIVLGFERASYLGFIENGALSLEPIILNDGYTDTVTFTLSGDLASYFTLQQQGSTVNIVLQTVIPEQTLPSNGLVLLHLRASGPDAIPATTVIVIEGQRPAGLEELAFSAPHYIGQYSETEGLAFDSIISLDVGYDQNVQFALEGEHSQWFALDIQGNAVTLTTTGAIPPAILVNNHHFIFHITAEKPNSNMAMSTIVVSLVDDYTDAIVLGFERASYLGFIENGALSLEPIILNEGYTDTVTFTLSGDLASYFTLQQQGSTVNIVLQTVIPEQTLPSNGLVLLHLRASGPDAIPATTVIVIEGQRPAGLEELAFSAPHYIGQYSETEGLAFDSIISLDVGYDQNVQFALEGEHSQWFALDIQGNAVTLTTTGAIPPAILVNNHHFIFHVTAEKPNSNMAMSTIVVSLVDDYTDAIVLGFERASYLGFIENDALSLEPIILNDGYTDTVTFTLSGDLASYFTLQQQGSTVNIVLQTVIPEQTLPSNGLVLLHLRASGPDAIPATTVIVIEGQRPAGLEELAFSAPHYIGQYSETEGLAFDSIISLDVGYDQNVQFALEGEHSQWFALDIQGNAVTLTTTGAIPPAILVNNHHFIFHITAEKPNSNMAMSTIVVSLVDDYTDAIVLGFERASYLGFIENGALSLEPIILNEGYTDTVTFTLSGDLASYFTLQQQGSTVNIVLQTVIPEQTLPSNGLVLLHLRASGPDAIPATTVIVIECQRPAGLEELAFSAPHYIGQYSETEGLAFDSIISLDVGYDQNVQFALEGEHSQWFALDIQGNAVTLTTTGAIPPAILVNNHHFIFHITAEKPNSNMAMSTIVVSLVDDYTDAIVLGFERASYLGFIENGALSLESIILNEGYTDTVTFTLSGDLASYFTLQQQGSTVNIVLQTVIPEQTLPSNGLVLLHLRASGPDAIPATTVIVIEGQRPAGLEELAFSAPHYIGQYSETEGLAFDSIISLDVGYDQNVQFALEGEHSQWFALDIQGNAVTLTTTGAIPPAILVNNHHFIFHVTAEKPNSNMAMSTIVVSLVDDYTDAIVLGFERASYLGFIENDALSLEPIILNEGYTDTVTFTLSGDLASYFTLQQQGSTVNIVLQTVIPEQTLPSNGLVLLHLRASGPDAIPATTVIVIEGQRPAGLEELAFSAPHYIGQYSETEGLAFDSIISLDVGYDQNVQFALEGEHSQWFALDIQGNAVTLTTTGAIPPAILVNKHHFIFHITAEKPNSNMAMSTIVVSLVDDYTDAIVLGFERASYLGFIENDALSLEPIILNEGYTDTVTFTLSGDLASYFTLQQQGSTVNIVLQTVIPEQTLPSNGLVLLHLRASGPDAIPATTVIVIEGQRPAGLEELAFSAPHYIGQYSETEGLAFDSIISLDVGYDQNVQFALEGEHSQWFALDIQGNAVTLTTTGAIPPAILVNNHHFIFHITAEKPNSNMAMSTIVVSLVDDYTDAIVLGFERASYLGFIENGALSLEPIILNEGYTDTVTFTLSGDLASYFTLQQQGFTVNIVLQTVIPEQTLPSNGLVLLHLRASGPDAIPATTVIVIEGQRPAGLEELAFSAPHYIGQYSETEGLAFDSIISLDVGYDQNVQFALEGEHAQWFALEIQGNAVTLTMSSAIPPAILVNNHQLLYIITAQKPNSNIASATVVISLVDDYTAATVLGFERNSYLGSIENDALNIEPIVLTEGYTDAVTFTLSGDLASYFNLQRQGATVNIVLLTTIPEQALPANGLVFLEMRASEPQSVPATTTIVVKVLQADNVEELAFSAAYYIGEYSETSGLAFDSIISLDVGYNQNVEFSLVGEHSQWFTLQIQGNAVTLATTGAIPPAILVNNHQLVFSVAAQTPNSNGAIATIVISLIEDYTDAPMLGFERASYIGSIENNVLSLESIVLSEGYTDVVTFTIHGDLSSYFYVQQQGSTVNIVLQSVIPEQLLPVNRILILEVRASAAQAVPATTTVVLEVQRNKGGELAFNAAYYIGEYSETGGLTMENYISLDAGYDENVWFSLEGDHVQWFALSVIENSITVYVVQPIPTAVLADLRKIIMIIRAVKSESETSAVIVISITDDSGSVINEAFDKVLYEGTINNNVVQHEPMTITGHAAGINIEILGGYRELFSATVSGDAVVVDAVGTLNLPESVTNVALELRAGSASAVLIFGVTQSEIPELPTVAFGSTSYVLRADMSQTGLLGLVQATASNGESIAYSLAVNDAHLRERISINSVGEIHLSAPTNTGVYSFEAIAISTITQVQATATVQLTVEAAAICGDDHALPPLIILDRDEEEPHANLVVLDSVAQAGCQFRLTNRWPLDQDWLYVDDTGLHARAIDREDPRIAFMALSQVQVELVLECASDTQSRVKRSTINPRLDWLGPYEYGNNKWILTDTILYNSRRSFVNLIVNDINDNYPIFVDNENEPVICGYPIPELQDIVLPRALAELKATDADVGENAALSFWSSSEVLAVAPTTGFVHLRDGASLTHDQSLTVSVTDLNGREDGLTTSIELLVKLLDTSHIAVVTVRNAFLDQEETILGSLSSAVGYEVKVLSSAVISDDPADSANARRKRQVTTEGASLQLYVYGVIDREPVAVDQLTNDITENVSGVDVTSTVSLEDYLEGREIYRPGRDTGLLVSTIVLSILLFILMLLIALWFLLRWRKERNYDQFSDANSLASRNESIEPPPKVDSLKKPRLNIDELKRSERRLQEMLDAPIDEVVPKAQTSKVDPEQSVDTIINISPTRPTDVALPIVIQSIDKLKDDENSEEEDEFGERKSKSRRKSVVTFNENVEKIIHVEDIPDDNSSDVEVFKF